MSDILFTTGFMTAFLVYAGLSVGLGLIHARFGDRLPDLTTKWLWEHFYLPVMRSGVLLVFIVMAYPVLFGLEQPPDIAGLLATDSGMTGKLIGIIFLLSLLVPLLPFTTSPAFVLPLQGIFALAMIFARLPTEAAISIWPGFPTVLVIVAIAVLSWRLGQFVKNLLSPWSGAVLDEAILLLFQSPTIILYATALGAQLAN